MTDQSIRQQFPVLKRKVNRKPLIFLDGPAGTHVPTSVIDAISNYYEKSNANKKGYFITSQETDEMMDGVRQKTADFLGAKGPQCISFSANMTTINYQLSHAIAKKLQPGDEITITQIDHEANRGPWLNLQNFGIVVREVRLLENGTLDYEDFKNKINERTRLVAMNFASNIVGTVSDVALIRKWTYEVNAWLLLDAVHYAPHLPLDVTAIGCDFLLCSAYKFYGPHVGILYAKEGLLDSLTVDNLRTAPQNAPYKIETGTTNHAAIAGVGAALDFIASFGKGRNYRKKIRSGMAEIHKREKNVFTKLYDGLNQIKGITIYGPENIPDRAPTISFTVKNKTAAEVCQHLASNNICAWAGHFYAVRATEVLGLQEKGGVVRMGMAVYTTEKEIEQVINILKKYAH
ncbi:MAG: cysteine desulfurase-like protein [Bacteroidota bacterium]